MTGEVPASAMHFSGEPTSDGDNAAEYLRAWYEANRETDKERRKRLWEGGVADSFMLRLLNEVTRINAEEARQKAGRSPRPDIAAIAALIRAHVRLEWRGHDHADINHRSTEAAAAEIAALLLPDPTLAECERPCLQEGER